MRKLLGIGLAFLLTLLAIQYISQAGATGGGASPSLSLPFGIGGSSYVVDSPQVCDPQSRPSWAHVGLSQERRDRYDAWLQCNPPNLDLSKVPGADGCSLYATGSYDRAWQSSKSWQEIQAAWFKNQDVAWHTNPDYWRTAPDFDPGGTNRLPYDYYVYIPTLAWDESPDMAAPGSTSSSAFNMNRLNQDGKRFGAQVVLCQDAQGRYSYKAVYWESVHTKGLPAMERYGTIPLVPDAWGGHFRFLHGHFSILVPGNNTITYGFTVTQSEDALQCQGNPPSQMTVWFITWG